MFKLEKVQYLIVGALVIWTIILVNDDWVGDIVQENILKSYVVSLARWCPRKCLDPKPIGCARNGAVLHVNVSDIVFIFVFSQASNAAQQTQY